MKNGEIRRQEAKFDALRHCGALLCKRSELTQLPDILMTSPDFLNGTIAVRGGEEVPLALGSAQIPIFQSAAFAYRDVETWEAAALGTGPGDIYSRNSNPTVTVFEEKVRLLERAEAATSFASGMAAISNTLFSLLRPGDRVVSVTDTYGGTSKLFLKFLPQMNITVDLVETGDHAELDRSISRGCKVVYLETPTNPTLKIVDLRRAIAAARRVDAITVVDNTFATPINQLPIELGADLVVHSATKFLGGHDDAMGGVLAGTSELVSQVHHYREINGACLSAMSAYLLLRGMKTLELRVGRQKATALSMATYLSEHPAIESVFYPGLVTHRDHSLAANQMTGYGGVLSFALKGTFENSSRFLNALQLAQRAASLGSVNTLAGPPRTTSHVECTVEERAKLGIPESLVRYSCGIENFSDLRADVEQALSRSAA